MHKIQKAAYHRTLIYRTTASLVHLRRRNTVSYKLEVENGVLLRFITF